MTNDSIEILQRALERERKARKEAERILELKSLDLYRLTEELKISNAKLEAMVREKTSQLEGVFENIVDAYVVMDVNGDVLKMNEAAVQLLECESITDELNLTSLVHPSELEHVAQGFKDLYHLGAITDFHVKIVTLKGNEKLVHINASVIHDSKGEVVAAQGIVRDITKEKEAEEQLIRSESRLASLIRNLDSGILLESEDRKIVLTNTKFCELFQIDAPPEALIGVDCVGASETAKHLFKDEKLFIQSINDQLEERSTMVGLELKMKNGKILERDFIPIVVDGEYTGHLWAYRDVTLTRRYRESLEAQREKYSSIIANMNLGLLEVNNDDEILLVNQSFEKMSGYSEKELLGKKGRKVLLKKSHRDMVEHANSKRLEGKSNSYEVTAITKSGEERQWLISGAPNYDINGEVVGSIGIHLDITDLKELQRQKENLLQQLERRNEQLEEYAHVVSHDLKSPLRSIYALVNWIKEDNLENLNAPTLENISLIEKTLERMEKLISDVLAFSSATSPANLKEKVDLSKLIEEIKQVLIIPDHITLSVENELPVILGNEVQMQQVFQNLISNAIKYNDKEKGFVEVDVIDKGTEFLFSVRDNGMGIEKKYFDKIFEIFQRLNTQNDSSGIGLSIVKKIIAAHGGSIWLESKIGEGTTFYFTIKKHTDA